MSNPQRTPDGWVNTLGGQSVRKSIVGSWFVANGGVLRGPVTEDESSGLMPLIPKFWGLTA